MPTKISFLSILLLLIGSVAAAGDLSVTVLPNASIRYEASAKHIPITYTDQFSGENSPVYLIEYTQTPTRQGYWGFSLMHTGVYGNGRYGNETVPDNQTGGIYQTDRLNVGFDDVMATYHAAVKSWPVEALFNMSVIRRFDYRKDFVIQGASQGGFDDINEQSAEGAGVGLTGTHGQGRFYARWLAYMNYYILIADAKTDTSYGEVFQAQGGVGLRLWKGSAVEFGGLRRYWYYPGEDHEIATPDGKTAFDSWERQVTWTTGLYLRIEQKFL
jgi:hypothetical protein